MLRRYDRVIESFERASPPYFNEEEKRKYLHFVIVGGSPRGVEFGVELHDFVTKDLLSCMLT
jgi:NADH:ubiquinone reductase (non-electrogenic)